MRSALIACPPSQILAWPSACKSPSSSVTPTKSPFSLSLCLESRDGSSLSNFQHRPLVTGQALAYPSPTLDVGHTLGVGVVPGEEGVMTEAAEAVGTRGLGLGGLQFLSDHLEIHDPWDLQFFLWSIILVVSWPVP